MQDDTRRLTAEMASGVTNSPEPLGRAVGTMDLTALTEQWNFVEALVPSLDVADRLAVNTSILSVRRFDEAKPMGTELYIHARQLIGASLDSTRALRKLLETYGVTPWAPWVLLRAAFEAAALAVWLLDDDSSMERRRRSLRRVIEDRRQWASWQAIHAREDATAFQAFNDRLAELEKHHDGHRQSLGMTAEQAKTKLSLVDVIPKFRAVQSTDMDPKHYANLWRALSGMSHGFPYAMMANTVEHEASRRPGGQTQLRSIDDTAWEAHASASSLLLLNAIQLYSDRSRST